LAIKGFQNYHFKIDLLKTNWVRLTQMLPKRIII
jgi:hypothetical protein